MFEPGVALIVAGENVCPFIGVFHALRLNKLNINIKISVGISKKFVAGKDIAVYQIDLRITNYHHRLHLKKIILTFKYSKF